MKAHMNCQNLLKANLALLFLLLLPSFAQAQSSHSIDSLVKKYKLAKYTVNNTTFLVYKKTELPKTTLLFITGSGFIPLFVNGDLLCFPFNPYALGNDFNLVIVSKPGIPLFADSVSNKYMNYALSRSIYLTPDGKVPEEFIRNNNCHYYEDQHLNVINFLNNQPWCKKNDFVVIGHSQGARVAASLALRHTAISKLVLLSPGSIYSRFHQSIKKIRMDENFGQVKPEEAQRLIDSVQSRFKELIKNKNDNTHLFDGSTYLSNYSFNFPSTKEKLTGIKQKTLIVYGTNSIEDGDCDYLKLDTALCNKNNIEVRTKIGYNHNFFENIVNENGEVTRRKFHWDDVITEVGDWIKTNTSKKLN